MDNVTINTDLLIIGAGPGGYVAAIYAAKKGLEVTLVDKAYVGGTCLNVGCIPTKALVKSAEVYTEAKNASLFGVNVENATIDMKKVIERKVSITKTLVDGIQLLLSKNNVNVIQGTATFESNKIVRVSTDSGSILYEPTNIIIATGSKTKHLPIPGIDNDFVIDSEQLLDNSILPEKMTVIGGGIIGMEFAFIYGHFGVKVDVLEFLPSILPTIDKDLSQRLIRYAKQNNITITTNAQVTKIEKSEQGNVKISYIHKADVKTIDADLVLEAVGRIPCTDGLGLTNTSIATGKTGNIPVDKAMRTALSNIYAIGDVTNIMQLAHVASHQALVAVDNILQTESEMNYDFVPSVIFTVPQIATVGKSEIDLIQSGVEYTVSKVPFSANGKALIMDNALGFIKLIQNAATKELVGAAVFGGDGEHLIASLTLAIKNKLSYKEIKDTIFAHPTISELIHEAFLGLNKEAIHYLD